MGTGGWLVGRNFSVADIGVATHSRRHDFAVSPDSNRYPKLNAYIDRALARASFADAIAKGKAMLGLK
jgi:glutathione S-transferase